MSGHLIHDQIAVNCTFKTEKHFVHFLTDIDWNYSSLSDIVHRSVEVLYTSKYNEEYLTRCLNVPKTQHVVGLVEGETYEIETYSSHFYVNVLNANYSPGSVMFLFQGAFGNVLFTGNCLMDVTSPLILTIDRIIGKSNLDAVYIDSTNMLSFNCKLKTMSEATMEMCDIIRLHKSRSRIILAAAELINRRFLKAILEEFKIPVCVSKRKKIAAKLEGFHSDMLTTDEECCIVCREFIALKQVVLLAEQQASCTGQQHAVIYFAECVHSDLVKRNAIALGELAKRNVFLVFYSGHSSFKDVKTFLQVFPSKNIVLLNPRAMDDTKGARCTTDGGMNSEGGAADEGTTAPKDPVLNYWSSLNGGLLAAAGLFDADGRTAGNGVGSEKRASATRTADTFDLEDCIVSYARLLEDTKQQADQPKSQCAWSKMHGDHSYASDPFRLYGGASSESAGRFRSGYRTADRSDAPAADRESKESTPSDAEGDIPSLISLLNNTVQRSPLNFGTEGSKCFIGVQDTKRQAAGGRSIAGKNETTNIKDGDYSTMAYNDDAVGKRMRIDENGNVEMKQESLCDLDDDNCSSYLCVSNDIDSTKTNCSNRPSLATKLCPTSDPTIAIRLPYVDENSSNSTTKSNCSNRPNLATKLCPASDPTVARRLPYVDENSSNSMTKSNCPNRPNLATKLCPTSDPTIAIRLPYVDENSSNSTESILNDGGENITVRLDYVESSSPAEIMPCGLDRLTRKTIQAILVHTCDRIETIQCDSVEDVAEETRRREVQRDFVESVLKDHSYTAQTNRDKVQRRTFRKSAPSILRRSIASLASRSNRTDSVLERIPEVTTDARVEHLVAKESIESSERRSEVNDDPRASGLSHEMRAAKYLEWKREVGDGARVARYPSLENALNESLERLPTSNDETQLGSCASRENTFLESCASRENTFSESRPEANEDGYASSDSELITSSSSPPAGGNCLSVMENSTGFYLRKRVPMFFRDGITKESAPPCAHRQEMTNGGCRTSIKSMDNRPNVNRLEKDGLRSRYDDVVVEQAVSFNDMEIPRLVSSIANSTDNHRDVEHVTNGDPSVLLSRIRELRPKKQCVNRLAIAARGATTKEEPVSGTCYIRLEKIDSEYIRISDTSIQGRRPTANELEPKEGAAVKPAKQIRLCPTETKPRPSYRKTCFKERRRAKRGDVETNTLHEECSDVTMMIGRGEKSSGESTNMPIENSRLRREGTSCTECAGDDSLRVDDAAVEQRFNTKPSSPNRRDATVPSRKKRYTYRGIRRRTRRAKKPLLNAAQSNNNVTDVPKRPIVLLHDINNTILFVGSLGLVPIWESKKWRKREIQAPRSCTLNIDYRYKRKMVFAKST